MYVCMHACMHVCMFTYMLHVLVDPLRMMGLLQERTMMKLEVAEALYHEFAS